MPDVFSQFLFSLQQGELSTWRKTYEFLLPVAARAAHALCYSREEAVQIAFDSLKYLPGKISQVPISREEDLRAFAITEVYLRCLPVLENLGTGPLGKWKEALVQDRVSTEREIFVSFP